MPTVEPLIEFYCESDGGVEVRPVREEFLAFLRSDGERLRDDASRALKRLERMSEGEDDPYLDHSSDPASAGERLYAYVCGALATIYAIDGPEGYLPRSLVVLRVGRSSKGHPLVKDLRLARYRLSRWREGEGQ